MKPSCLTRPLTRSELTAILGILPDYWKQVVTISLATGLRLSDMMNLHVDLSLPRFTIREQKTGKPKSVCLPSWALNSWIWLRDHHGPDNHLLTCRDKSTYRRAMKRFCLAAGVDSHQISWHSWRKTTASLICETNGIAAAQVFLNHSSASTTMAYLSNDQMMIENLLSDNQFSLLGR